MRFVSWNVAGRSVDPQLAALHSMTPSPDVVALQEITIGTKSAWLEGLPALGLVYRVASLDLLAADAASRGRLKQVS